MGDTSVHFVGEYAFWGALDCSWMRLPTSLCGLGEYCFAESGLFRIDLSCTKVTCLPEGAFFGAQYLFDVCLPPRLRLIGRACFSRSGVTELHLRGTRVEGISGMACEGAYRLGRVSFPSSLSRLGERCFKGSICSSVDLGGTRLLEVPYAAFEGVRTLRNAHFPIYLRVIGDSAFSMTGLAGVDLSGTAVREIGADAFYRSKIRYFIFPRALERVGVAAFKMTIIEEADLGHCRRGIYLGDGCFEGCQHLTELRTPVSIADNCGVFLIDSPEVTTVFLGEYGMGAPKLSFRDASGVSLVFWGCVFSRDPSSPSRKNLALARGIRSGASGAGGAQCRPLPALG